MLHKAMQNKGARIAIAVFATLLYALGVNLFIVPVGLYSGGMVGLSQVIRTVLTERVALPAGGYRRYPLFPFECADAHHRLEGAWARLSRPHAYLRGRVVLLFERHPGAGVAHP